MYFSIWMTCWVLLAVKRKHMLWTKWKHIDHGQWRSQTKIRGGNHGERTVRGYNGGLRAEHQAASPRSQSLSC